MSMLTKTLDIPKEPAFRRAWFIYQLRLRGLTLRKLAAREGVHYSAISAAILQPNAHLEPIIAKALGFTVEQLFPERFDASGRRLHLTRERSRERRPSKIKAGAGV